MTPDPLQSELFSQLAEPLSGEALFDCLPGLVFFIKNARSEYIVSGRKLVFLKWRGTRRAARTRSATSVAPSTVKTAKILPRQ